MASTDTDSDSLVALLRERGLTGRSITAVAGPPGAGKSTLADALAARLNAAEPDSAAVLPMDGYHFDDIVLEARGDRPRKGAPHTFDVGGFAAILARLRANAEAEVAVPVFDRDIEIARNAARIIPRKVRHLIVEGNYLLLDMPPWSGLAPLFDTTVFIEVPMPVLESRLTDRWKALDADAFVLKMEGNDLPNVRLVKENSRPADFVIGEE